MASKWIVQGNIFKIGQVQMHMDLRTDHINEPVHGGGWWHCNLEKKTIYLYKLSIDFGQCTKEQVIEGFKNTYIQRSLTGFKVKFTLNQYFSDDDETIIESLER